MTADHSVAAEAAGRMACARRALLAAAAAVSLPLVARAADAPTKAAAIKYREADGPLSVEVVDLTPRFLDFYAAARAVADPDARYTLWKARYDFAAVPPTPEGEKMARGLLDAAWLKYKAALPVIGAGAHAMQPDPLEVLKSVAAVLKPDAPVAVQTVVYVGGFDKNAFTYAMNGLPVVCVPVEMGVEERRLIFTHEMTHGVHISIGRLSGGWERTIGTTVLQEGLAMQVTRTALPNRPVEDYVSSREGWWPKAQARKTEILKGILPYLDAKDSETVFRFTVGQGTTGLIREAYVAGWFTIDQLRADGMSLPQIARIPETQMPAVVRKAIGDILAGAG